ncbi:hypothetical protein [Streptomyces sp. NBC_00829]|uniref:hypothetical protein n=1 Tax=Streptomyces sp. NBC_00829 TaxID=2903679 RepID=UPI00386D6A67|nr:hypothetical protein OG293_34025 [Streptomyces sp. NBC_00829]
MTRTAADLRRELVRVVEERYRNEGRDGIRLAVLENSPSAQGGACVPAPPLVQRRA